MSNTISSNQKVVFEHQKKLINQIKSTFSKITRIEENIKDSNTDKLIVYFTPDFSDINESITVKIALIHEIIEYNASQNIKSPEKYYRINNRISAQLAYVTGRVDKTLLEISHLSEVENFSIKDIEMRDGIYPTKKEVLNKLNEIFDSFQNIREQIINSEMSELEYLKRFKEESNLILKSFENKVDELTSEYENKFKNFDLGYEKISKSNELLGTGVDAGLKALNLLNERTQNVELEFSKIISAESEKVKKDLNSSRTALNNVIQEITTSANTKLNEINKAHTDFINLVEKAGIYELTQNYKTKADEEKKDYKLNMWLTIGSIALAIFATIAVISIPIIEHWKATPPVPMDYFTLFARLSISLMFFVLALYTSKQAAKHYECYQENHRTFLQLAALEPFMSRMSHDEQKEIRKGLIPSYFNQGTDGKFAAKGDEVDLPTNIHAIVNRAFDLVGEKKEPKTAENTATDTKASV